MKYKWSNDPCTRSSGTNKSPGMVLRGKLPGCCGESAMLGKGIQSRGQGIALFDPFSLVDKMLLSVVRDPHIRGYLPVNCPDKWQQRRRDGMHCGEYGGPGDGVISGAPIEADNRRV